MKTREEWRQFLFDNPGSAWFRAPLLTAVGVLVWKFQSKGLFDALVWLAFLYALWHARDGIGHWRNAAGFAFAGILVFTLATLPLSVSPMDSLRDLVRMAVDLAAVFVIAVLFHTRRRIAAALLYSAAALTLLLGFDLARLAWRLRGDLLTRAHAFEPFILNHSNVASMMAGAAFIVLAYFAWTSRRRPWRLALCLLGMAVNLVYQVVVASRGPQVAFATAMVLSGAVVLPGWRRKLAWIAAAAAVVIALATNVDRINPRFLDKVSMRGLRDRDKVWAHTWELSRQRPLLGYGYGKRVFHQVYRSTNPPESPFDFPHAHEYWLFTLFQHGWIGVSLYATAWLLLTLRLLRSMARLRDDADARLLAGTILILLLFIHVYGLADWPDNVVLLMLWWLIPAALVVTARPAKPPAAGSLSSPARP